MQAHTYHTLYTFSQKWVLMENRYATSKSFLTLFLSGVKWSMVESKLVKGETSEFMRHLQYVNNFTKAVGLKVRVVNVPKYMCHKNEVTPFKAPECASLT